MEHIEEIKPYDLPDTKQELRDMNWETVPNLSAKNIESLIEKMNEVINTVNQLIL